jgi:hypothetical protein
MVAQAGVAHSRVFWWAAASAALMVVGSFGPWARAFVFTVSGVDGDGWFVVAAAGVAGVVLYLHRRRDGATRWPLFVAALMGLVGLVVVGVDGKDIFGSQATGSADDFFGGADLVQPGWGIVMAGLASASLAVAALVLFAMTHRSTSHDGAPSTDESLDRRPSEMQMGQPTPSASEQAASSTPSANILAYLGGGSAPAGEQANGGRS